MQTESKAHLSRSFLELALQLTQDLDIDTILVSIVERAMDLTGSRYGAAVTLADDGSIERFLHRGLTPEQVAMLPHLPRGEGLLGAVLKQASPLRVTELGVHPSSVGFPDRHVPMDAFLGVPIAHRGTLVGAIYLTKPPGQAPFSDTDEDLVTAMAALAAVGINNTRTLTRAHTRAGITDSIREIASSVKTSLEAEEVLSTTVEELGRAAGVSRCYIRMVEAPGVITLGPIEYEWDAPGVRPLAAEPDVQFPVAGLAARTRMTQWSDNVEDDPRLTGPGLWGRPLDLVQHDARSVLATPLERGDELLGVIVFHNREARHWTDDDITLIEGAAHEVATAIYHAYLYEEAMRTVEDLQELERRRADYIAMVSHEIRNPITVVAGIAEILQGKRNNLPDATIQDLLDSLQREANRLARLVSEVLDLERIDKGGMTLVLGPTNMVELARESVTDTGESSRTVVETDGDTQMMEGDRDKLKQVLVNLISNAAKFAPEASPITVTVRRQSAEVVVGVEDRGPGIPTRDQARLFQRFSRLDQTSGKPGSGLGLYLARLIVERHGGRIWVESEPGKGTTFFFAIPALD